ncbi:MAG: RNA degradosome polyphosphate kinase, partial [Vicinamibacterales bacterium]
MTPLHRHDATLFLNRELSWLAFDERVLDEAADPSTPLLERLKFAAITASNLDEFFMVRVAGLKSAVVDNDATPDLAGLTPAQQLRAVSERAHALVDRTYALVFGELMPALEREGVRLAKPGDLDARDRAALGAHFRSSVLPILTPLAIDVARPLPLLSSLSVNVAILLAPARGETLPRLAIVQVPPGLTRLVPVPGADGTTFVLLEEIIRMHLAQLFPGQQILETSMIRLARDAELELDDEGGRTHLDQVEREVRHRRQNDVVRLEIEEGTSSELVSLLCRQTEVEEMDVYAVRGPLDLRFLMALTDLPGLDALRAPPLRPVELIADPPSDIFAAIDEQDLLLHHPYDAYEPVLALLAQAAEDPDVLAIKQTLYRASPGSQLIASLRRAAERNKQVTVVVELTARFDEERNIQWA